MESTNARKLKGLPLQLKTGIDAGARYTTKEWARELETSVVHIEQALNRLNQHHKLHRYYPVDGIMGKKGGVLVDVTQKLEWMEQVLDRQELIFLNPQILSFASWADVSVTSLRKLLPKIKARLAEEISILTILAEKIKQR